MIDFHTHILPGMDDGAKTEEVSLQLLAMEAAQGVSALVLTPHYYPASESLQSFLTRRAESYAQLRRACEAQPDLPAMRLGAEVAWVMNLERMEHLEALCCEGTRYLLLELPMGRWDAVVFRSMDELTRLRGIIPVIAHLDRYLSFQKKQQLQQLEELGVPIQLGTEPFLHRGTLKKLGRFAAAFPECFLASDCHNVTSRAPQLVQALDAVGQKFDPALRAQLEHGAERLLAIV